MARAERDLAQLDNKRAEGIRAMVGYNDDPAIVRQHLKAGMSEHQRSDFDAMIGKVQNGIPALIKQKGQDRQAEAAAKQLRDVYAPLADAVYDAKNSVFRMAGGGLAGPQSTGTDFDHLIAVNKAINHGAASRLRS